MSVVIAAASPSARLRGRGLVLAAILLSAFNLRTAVTSLTPLLERIADEYAFGAPTMGALGMLPTAAFALTGVATPALLRRFGLLRTALLSMALATVGLVLRPLLPGTAGLLIGSLVALAGMGMGNVVLPPLVKRYFGDRVGGVSTLYITVLQVGTLLPALLAVPVADALGWRSSMVVWVLPALLALAAWAMVHTSHRRIRATGPAPVTPTPEAEGRVARTALGWSMAVTFGMTSLVTYSMFTWLPTLLREAGASPAFGGTMVALFAALGMVGALTMPALAVRMRNPFPIVLLCAACHLVAFAGLWWAPLAAPILWVTLLGLGPSTFPLALVLVNQRSRTAAGSAALSGFSQGMGYAVSCLGPFLFGWLHAHHGGWTSPFVFLVICILVQLAAAWVACRPQLLEDVWAPPPRGARAVNVPAD
ncbi:MFS transporter [Xanthomonas arboricola pv. zantedeschiae]|uniref:MFS transporter n=3 Tax=Xanthomonas arboricola TaxID=56448 RepID=W4SML9_9XANT|nr:CP family cyanate transporter-like MFS transporter [Xanthomonas arboricola]PMR87873.1 MFS transporter [Xanthomonas arboricola pv. juglandis]PPT86284.1 MFS transporter [Xanthomonas arboricola pv. zantedeschiae]QEX76005.1 MFS transporter [Xanthomonas arboricola pv. pruni]QWM99851.1 MFS transporter [Xanthomonas sp. MLO165]SOU01808.1 MFS transporter [Xanthomonas arboricola pv. fragariae]GAE53039.1 MFS transporter [Xanthomonas arboricola pv. pruni str. MAFF 311562]GAE57219.1 MFS transporter [X